MEVARLDREHSGVMSEIGENVRARRDRLGMTQGQLAREAGVNRDTVGAIEGGKGFTQRKLTQIEAALDRLEDEAGFDAPPLPPATGDLPACPTCGRVRWDNDSELMMDVLGAYWRRLNPTQRKAAFRAYMEDVLEDRYGRSEQ